MEADPAVAIFGSEEYDLYSTLDVPKEATADAIRSSYRRKALQCHPDKLANKTDAEKEAASTRFQQIGYAYAVLSDETRRKRYDSTGSTRESTLGPGENGSWEEYFKELWQGEVNAGTIDEFFKSYEGSDEEKQDIFAAYNESEGDIEHILAHCFSSDNTKAEDRFTEIINNGIASKELIPTKAWKRSLKDKKGRAKRQSDAKKEASEAETMAKKLGVHEKLFGGASSSKTNKKNGKSKDDGDEDALRALIQSKGAKRAQDSLAALEAKYTAIENEKKTKKGGKRAKKADADEDPLINDDDDDEPANKKSRVEMPTDAEFEALQAKLFSNDKSKSGKVSETSTSNRKTKRGR